MVKIEASVQREKKKSRIKFKSAELDKHLNNKKMEFVRNAYFISCYLSPKMIDKCLQMVHISRMIQMISPTNKENCRPCIFT